MNSGPRCTSMRPQRQAWGCGPSTPLHHRTAAPHPTNDQSHHSTDTWHKAAVRHLGESRWFTCSRHWGRPCPPTGLMSQSCAPVPGVTTPAQETHVTTMCSRHLGDHAYPGDSRHDHVLPSLGRPHPPRGVVAVLNLASPTQQRGARPSYEGLSDSLTGK